MAEVRKEYVNSTPNQKSLNERWWLSPDNERGKDMFGVVQSIEQRQNYRRIKNIHHARLYSNQPIDGLMGNTFYREAQNRAKFDRVRFNLVKSCIDTAQALIAQNKPRPLFLTEDGKWHEQQKAKKLTQFCDGEFDEQKVYSKGATAFRDAGVFGTGGFKFITEPDRIRIEKILTDEIIVDDIESIYGDPKCLYHRTFRHREVLKKLVEDSESDESLKAVKLRAIENAKAGIEKSSPSAAEASDMIYVVEGWHLKSGRNGKDGLRCIAIDNQELYSEPYKKDFFPFAFFKWCNPLIGFFGTGIAEELQGLQLEINKILRDISEAHHLFVVPTIMIEEHSPRMEIDNEIGRIIRYRGQKPDFFTPNGYPAEVYNHLIRLRQWGFEQIGLSPLSASSQKPAGLNSGVAIREYNDIQTVRFMIAGQAYEQFFLDAAYIFLDMSKDLYKNKKDKEIMIKGGKFIETVPWSDLDFEDERSVMRAFPTALLPKEPSARLERIQELQNAGWIDREYAMSLGDFPDLDQFINLQTADLENTRRMLDQMLEKDKYTPPEQFMNLRLALKLAQQSYIKGKIDGAPDSGLNLVMRFMSQCQDMIVQELQAEQTANQALPPPQGAPAQPQQPSPEQTPAPGLNGAAPIQ